MLSRIGGDCFMLTINQSKATSLGISQSAFSIAVRSDYIRFLTGFSSDLRFASQSPPANFKAAKRRSVFRLLLWHHVTLLNELTEIRYTVLLRTNLICLQCIYGHMYFYHKVPVAVYVRNMCAELQISLIIWEHPGVLRILSEDNWGRTSNTLTFCYIKWSNFRSHFSASGYMHR